jgi:predicted metal-dependent hydrolase
MIDLEGIEITYKWSPRRKSIALKVTIDGKLKIHAPRGNPPGKIAQVVARYKAWIHRKTAERREAWNRLKDGVAFFLGQAYRLTVVQDSKAGVELGPEEIRVRIGSRAPALWLQLRDWYRREAERAIQERVRHYSAMMGLKVLPAQVREWKSRWGECHPKAGLRFNWRLVMLPPEVLDYVVVHELTHLKVPGHPLEFWEGSMK